MRVIFIILFCIILSRICICQTKNNLIEAEVLYSVSSRSITKNVGIKNKTLTFSESNRDSNRKEQKEISENDWLELSAVFETLVLDSLFTLKSPTQKRFYDGAFVAYLKIFYKGKNYETQTFDYGFPPNEIKKFVDKIDTFTKKE